MKALFALLAVFAASFAVAQPFLIEVDHNLREDVVVDFSVMSQQNLDLQGGGISWPYTFSGSGSFNNPFEQGTLAGVVSMIGLYSLTESQNELGALASGELGVFALLNGFAGESAIGKEWEEVFQGFSESEVRDALLKIRDNNGGPLVDEGSTTISNFFSQNLNQFAQVDESGLYVGFSTGQNLGGGSWTQEPVPEPASLLALGAGLLLLKRRRRN